MEKIPIPQTEDELERRRLELVEQIVALKEQILTMSDGPTKSRIKADITRHENEIKKIEDTLYFHKKKAA